MMVFVMAALSAITAGLRIGRLTHSRSAPNGPSCVRQATALPVNAAIRTIGDAPAGGSTAALKVEPSRIPSLIAWRANASTAARTSTGGWYR
jgi:hypothetical protein